MDAERFGELSKQVARAATRRGMIGALLGGLAVPLLGAAPAAEAAFGYCRAGGFPCNRNQQCCTNRCQADGTCGCARKGKPCLNRVGVNCCSKRCRKGKCK